MTTYALPDHVHITERDGTSPWNDCTWAAGLEWYRLVYNAGKPATIDEMHALRRASGEPSTGGSNLDNLARGIKVRYGTTIPARIHGYTALRTALTPGKAAVIQGSMKAFGSTHRLSVYDRSFDGTHAVLLVCLPDGSLLWCDPEAPATANVPVPVSWAEVKAFVSLFNGEHVVGTIKRIAQEESVANLTSYLPGYTAVVKAGSNIRTEPRIKATLLHTTKADLPVTVVGTVKGDTDPANGSTVWYELWLDGRSEYTAKDNVTQLKAPAPAVDTTPYSKAQLDAAVAAAVAPLKKTLATIKTALGL